MFGKMKNFTDRFAAELSAQLSRVLSAKVEVAFTRTGILEPDEFRELFFSHTNRYAFACPKYSQAGTLWACLDNELCQLVVDCMLGARPEKPTFRNLTQVEQRLAGRVANLISGIVAGFSTTPTHMDRADITDQTIKPPQAGGINLLGYKVSIESFDTQLILMVPSDLILPNSSSPRFGSAPLQLTGEYSAATDLSAQDLASLKPGKILSTDIPVSSDITVKLAGIAKFKGKLALVDKKRAVKITGKF